MDTDVDDWLGHVRVLVDTQPSVQGVHCRCSQELSVGGTMSVCIFIPSICMATKIANVQFRSYDTLVEGRNTHGIIT